MAVLPAASKVRSVARHVSANATGRRSTTIRLRGHPRDVEQIVDEAGQMVGLASDDLPDPRVVVPATELSSTAAVLLMAASGFLSFVRASRGTRPAGGHAPRSRDTDYGCRARWRCGSPGRGRARCRLWCSGDPNRAWRRPAVPSVVLRAGSGAIRSPTSWCRPLGKVSSLWLAITRKATSRISVRGDLWSAAGELSVSASTRSQTPGFGRSGRVDRDDARQVGHVRQHRLRSPAIGSRFSIGRVNTRVASASTPSRRRAALRRQQ